MSAPTDVCQCGHEKKNHWPILLGGRNHCSTCDCKKFDARGLQPESQGDGEPCPRCRVGGMLDGRCVLCGTLQGELDRLTHSEPKGWPDAEMMEENLTQSPAPQPAEPCAQGVGKDARIAELEEEKQRRIYYQNIVYQTCDLIDRANGKKDGTGIVCGTIEAPSKEAQIALMELIARLAASETDRERLRAALEEAGEGVALIAHKFERAGGVYNVAMNGVELGQGSWASNVENGLHNATAAVSKALAPALATEGEAK